MLDSLQDLESRRAEIGKQFPVWVICAVAPFLIAAVVAASPPVAATSLANRFMVQTGA